MDTCAQPILIPKGSACISFKISPDECGYLCTAYYDTEKASLHIDTIEWSKVANAFVPS